MELPLGLPRFERGVASVREIRLPGLYGPVGTVACFAGCDEEGEGGPVVGSAMVPERLSDEAVSRLPTTAPVEPEPHLPDGLARGASVDRAPYQRVNGATARSVADEGGAAVHRQADTGRVYVQPFRGERRRCANGEQPRDRDDE